MSQRSLPEANARDDRLSSEWAGDNQQWWNWYTEIADNSLPEPEAAQDEAVVLPGSPATPDAAAAELTRPYALDPMAIDRFRRDGYVKLADVLSPGALALLRGHMTRYLVAELGEAPGLSFRSAEMMWLHDAVFRAFVLSPRIAQIAAALLGVPRVRLYHDNALAKEPGCGRTPWHYDRDHFPIATPNICTAWIPLQSIPRRMGPLGFAVGMETWRHVASVPFNKFDSSYDRAVDERFRARGVTVDDGPFALGEISFHHAYSFHMAGPNRTGESRMVLATTYFEDGARVVAEPTMISGDWRKFMPGVDAGETIDSPYNPVCYPPPEAD